MSNTLRSLTLAQAVKKLRAKEISLTDLYAETFSSIEVENKALNAYLTVNKDALNQAQEMIDSPLAGVPIAVKDNFSTKGVKTTASSTLLSDFVPQFDSTVMTKLKQAGGVVVGKTNMDAWAHGSSTETSQFGRTLNPRNTEYLPGGSSGGSAAAIAADLCISSIGSETAGSIRQPSAWCGTVGLKPTYGRVSRYGVVSMASSTDSPGPIAKTVEDAAILLNHIAGHDPYDGTTSPQPVPDFTAALNKSIKGMKIGVVYRDIKGFEESWKLFEPQLKVLENLGAHIEYAPALNPEYSIGVYTVVQRSEVSSNLARYSDVRYQHGRETFGAEAKRRIMLGTFTLSKGYADQYYNRAQQVRTLFIQDYEKLFSKYDALISLTSPGFAKKIGASETSSMFGELEDLLLEPSSIAGLPGINVPCYHDEATNLYLGMNILAPMWKEETMISIADAFEKNTSWNTWRGNE
jgi:aspartyl-tRNA(Asn)/glutamyl-tRNA(Gln) amidotransferase subunit A